MKRDFKWIITITVLSFIITLLFSFGSNTLLRNVSLVLGIIIILLFVLLGIIFDIIGVAVQSSKEVTFHAMASKKIRGAKTAKKMLANSDKVSSFCNDVIGDICNIISGSAGLVVAIQISHRFDLKESIVILLVSSLIAALTIGGKAIGKGYAVKKSEFIVSKVTKLINKFEKKKKKKSKK